MAVLTSTHNLYFGAKIRKIGIPLHTPVVLYVKVGYKGVYIIRTCFVMQPPFYYIKVGVVGVYISLKCFPGANGVPFVYPVSCASKGRSFSESLRHRPS